MAPGRAQPEAEDLAVALASIGLIQFGQFAQANGEAWPVAVHLRWLPSYPALLRRVAGELAPRARAAGADRMLTTREAIPLGTAVSLASDVLMVYPFGQEARPTRPHSSSKARMMWATRRCCYRTCCWARSRRRRRPRLARRVGLDIALVLALLDLDRGAREALVRAGFAVGARRLRKPPEMLPVLSRAGWLPPGMRAVVESWQAEQERG